MNDIVIQYYRSAGNNSALVNNKLLQFQVRDFTDVEYNTDRLITQFLVYILNISPYTLNYTFTVSLYKSNQGELTLLASTKTGETNVETGNGGDDPYSFNIACINEQDIKGIDFFEIHITNLVITSDGPNYSMAFFD